MNEGAVVAGIFFLIIVVLVICLIPMVFFLIHLQKLLNKCSVNNRAMEPGMVWLNLIPLFNLGWVFYTVFKVTESLKTEFKAFFTLGLYHVYHNGSSPLNNL